ncbi:hypothetical protein NDU88_003707 [Pleurodeles waltl]|uniref:Uncharacterized protein n=1 Tax=Pleurodeles waltl TaxID=8319 RepID=A0AAV7PDL8_PLEWA|nr:hypothetical protein NDU88_003707 [Pleurodeles waltl]
MVGARARRVSKEAKYAAPRVDESEELTHSVCPFMRCAPTTVLIGHACGRPQWCDMVPGHLIHSIAEVSPLARSRQREKAA